MTIIKYGGGITEMRGSIGSVVFSRNRAGAIARQRRKPAPSRSTLSAASKSLLSKYSGYWSGHLSDAQRVAWNALAAATDFTNPLAQTYNLNGRALYLRSAVLLAIAGETDQDDAPDDALEIDYVFSVAFDEYFGLAIRSVGAYSQDGEGSLIVAWSGDMPPTRYAHTSPWTHLDVLDFDFDDSLPFSLVAPLNVDLNRHYFFSFRTIRTDEDVAGDDWHGKASQPFFADCPALDWVSPYEWFPLNDDAANPTVSELVQGHDEVFEDDTGDPNTDAHSVAGPYEKGFSFDGIDDRIGINADKYNGLLAANSRFCFNLWIRHPAAAIVGNHYHAGKRAADSGRYIAWDSYEWNDSFRLYFVADAGAYVLGCFHANAQDNSWHMYTIQRSATDVEFYVDGAVQVSDHAAGWDTALVSAAKFWLGYNLGGYGQGWLADFRAYADSLSPAQILALYNATP